MSDIRKQFEDWFEAEAMPAEANWFARDEDGFYKLAHVQRVWEAWEKLLAGSEG